MISSLLRLPLVASIALSSLSCLVAISPASAQQAAAPHWPDKPIRMVLPAPPGGITDMVARLVAEQLRVNLGQTVLVDNRPGGAAGIAEQAVMAAPADGYTWMMAPSSVMSDIPLTVKKSYDVLKTFTYVAEASGMVHVLVANANFPPNNINEVLDYAKRNPRSVSVANHSVGTRSNLLGEMLREKSGTDMLIVPYKGSAPILTDLLGNQVQMTFEVVGNVMPFIKSGRLKALAVVSSTRSQHLPHVPTFTEVGLPDFVLPHASVGVSVLSTTPKPIIDRIRSEMDKVVRSAKFREALIAQGLEFPQEGSLDQLRQVLAATSAHNQAVIKKLKLKLGAD